MEEGFTGINFGVAGTADVTNYLKSLFGEYVLALDKDPLFKGDRIDFGSTANLVFQNIARDSGFSDEVGKSFADDLQF